MMKRTGDPADRLSAVLLGILAVAILIPLIFFLRTARLRNTPLRIVAVSKTLDFGVEFWAQVKSGLEEAAQEYEVDLDFRAPATEADIDDQIALLYEALAEKPDALILAPTDSQRLEEAARAVQEAGIPLILLDTGLADPELAASLTLVATDNVRAGEKAGQALGQRLQAGDTVAILSHNVHTTSAIDREAGARRELSADYRLLPTVDCQARRDKAYEAALELLDNEELTALLCTNEYTTAGALEALAEKGLAGQVLLVGFDNSYALIDALESGTLEATVIQKAFNMGYLALEKAVRRLEGSRLLSFYDSDSVLITRDDMYEEENEKLLFPFEENN